MKFKKIDIIIGFVGILVAIFLFVDTLINTSTNVCYNELMDLRQQYTEKYLQQHQLESYMSYYQTLRTVSIIQNYTKYADEMQNESVGFGDRIKNTNDQVRVLSRDIVWKSRDCNKLMAYSSYMPLLIFVGYFSLVYLFIIQLKRY